MKLEMDENQQETHGRWCTGTLSKCNAWLPLFFIFKQSFMPCLKEPDAQGASSSSSFSSSLFIFFFSQTLDTSMKFFPLTILFDHQKAFFCMRGIPLHDSKITHAQIIFSIILITDQLIPIILDMKYMAVLILWISLVINI